MAKSYESLVRKAITIIDQFPASEKSLDDFIQDASRDLKDMEPQHQEFVIIVVSGCIEQKKILDIIINSFFGHDGKYLKQSKYCRSQFVVICYLTLFHFADLGLQAFTHIVRSLNIKSMHNFLKFFFRNLTTWIQDELYAIYDAQYVDDHWIDPLIRCRSNIDAFIEKLGACQMPDSPSKTSEPVEAVSNHITPPPSQPQPEFNPLPEKHIHAKSVPSSLYTIPKEILMLEELKQRNHQMREELLYEANLTRYKCARPQKSEHTMRVLAKIQEELDSKLNFDSVFKSQPCPANKKTWPVKLNSATILRQRALHDRKAEEELQRIENLVEGGHEPSSFLQWQKDMRDKDHQEKTAMVDQKHADTFINHLKIAIERSKATELKQKATRLEKEVSQIAAQKRMQQLKESQDVVYQVSTISRKNVKQAKDNVKKFKQSVAKQVSEHTQKLLRQAQEEAQAEFDRKFEAISEHHTIEHVPLNRLKYFDDTETAGHKLLEEMSHAELKERLFFRKEADMIEQQKKRDRILEEKQKKQQLLLEEMDNINLHSRVMGMAATFRKEEEREAKLRLQQAREKTGMALQKKLEEKKQEYQKMKKNLRYKAKPAKEAAVHTIKTKVQSEAVNWEDLEQSLEEYTRKRDSQVAS